MVVKDVTWALDTAAYCAVDIDIDHRVEEAEVDRPGYTSILVQT